MMTAGIVVPRKDLEEWIREVDTDGNRALDLGEFVMLVRLIIGVHNVYVFQEIVGFKTRNGMQVFWEPFKPSFPDLLCEIIRMHEKPSSVFKPWTRPDIFGPCTAPSTPQNRPKPAPLSLDPEILGASPVKRQEGRDDFEIKMLKSGENDKELARDGKVSSHTTPPPQMPPERNCA
jgi:hypothetical protein